MSWIRKELTSDDNKYSVHIEKKSDFYLFRFYVLIIREVTGYPDTYEPFKFLLKAEEYRGSEPIITAQNLMKSFQYEKKVKEYAKADIVEWVRLYSGCSDTMLIPTDKVKVFSQFGLRKKEKINVQKIIRVGGLYIVEEIDEHDDWLMGDINKQGEIVCWGSYGSIKNVIDGL